VLLRRIRAELEENNLNRKEQDYDGMAFSSQHSQWSCCDPGGSVAL
jgi:hypothetical protein